MSQATGEKIFNIEIMDEEGLGLETHEVIVSYTGYYNGVGSYEFHGSVGHDQGDFCVDDWKIEFVDSTEFNKFDKEFRELVEGLIEKEMERADLPDPNYV
jgi:hypothetical protein